MKRSVREAVAAARKAERGLARFHRLTQMTPAELATTLGGPIADSAHWIRTAAIHGNAEAQLRLGAMLLEGTGVERDPVAACRWFGRAAHSGQSEAMNMLGRCHENGWGTEIDERKAARWYQRSAEASHDWGEYNYAHMLFDGRGGVRRNLPAAFAYYRRAARQGHARAMNLVARCLEAGWGVRANAEEAVSWYGRSAEAGYFRAQFNYAAILAQRGDIASAMHWLQRARAEGDAAMQTRVTQLLSAMAPPLRQAVQGDQASRCSCSSA